MSDDLEWCRKHLLTKKLKDVVIASKSPQHDLALLATSDHTIIDYGTFGEWGAVMAGGHTISLDVDKNFSRVMSEFTDKWHVCEMKRFEEASKKTKKKVPPSPK